MDIISDDEPTIPHPRRNYGILLTGNFIWFFALGLYSNFITLYIRGLGANPLEIGIYLSVFFTSTLIFTGLAGPLATRFGEKPILVLSYAVIIPAPIIYLFAPTWHWTLLGAIIEGVSMLAIPPLRTYIRHVTGGKHRGFGYSLLISSIAIAWIPSPLLGGYLITWLGYTTAFLAATALYLISTFFILFISSVPRTPEIQLQKKGQEFFSNRTFLFATLLMVVIISVQTFTNLFVPLFLSDNFGLQEDMIGVLYAILNGSGAVLGPLLSMSGDRWGHTKILPFSVTSYFVVLGLLVLLPSSLLLAPVFILWSCYYGISSMVNAIISHNVQATQLTNAFAVFTFFQRILTPFTPFLGGITYAITPSLPLATASLLLPLPLIILVLLHRTQKSEKTS